MSRAAAHVFNAVNASASEESGDGDFLQYFRLLPDSSLYPDYYKIISRPISFHEIGEALKGQPIVVPADSKGASTGDNAVSSRSYTSHSVGPNKYTLEDICRDIRRLISNAKKYNQSGSIVYQHALAVDRALRRAVKQVEELNLDYAEDDDSEEETALWSGCLQLRADLEAEESANARELQEVLQQKRARASMFKPHRTHKQARWEEIAKAAPDDADLLCRGAESIALHHARKLGRHPFIGPSGRMADSWTSIQPYEGSSPAPANGDSQATSAASQTSSNGDHPSASPSSQQQSARHRRHASSASGSVPPGARAPDSQWTHWANHTPAHEWPSGTIRNPQDTENTAGALWRRAWLKRAQTLAAGLAARGQQEKEHILAATHANRAVSGDDGQLGVAYVRFRVDGDLSAPLRAIVPAGVVGTPALEQASPLLVKGPLADKPDDTVVKVGGISFPAAPQPKLAHKAVTAASGAWRYDRPLHFGADAPTEPTVIPHSPAFAALLRASCASSAAAAAGLSIDVTPHKPVAGAPAAADSASGLLTPSFRSSSSATAATAFRARAASDASMGTVHGSSPMRSRSGISSHEHNASGWDNTHTALWRHQYMQGLIRVHKCRVQAAGRAAALAAARREEVDAELHCTDAAAEGGHFARLTVNHVLPSAAIETFHGAGGSKYAVDAATRSSGRAVQGLLKLEDGGLRTPADDAVMGAAQHYVLVEWNPKVETGVVYAAPCATHAPPCSELAQAFAHDEPVHRLQSVPGQRDVQHTSSGPAVSAAPSAETGSVASGGRPRAGTADTAGSTPASKASGRKGVKRRRSSVVSESSTASTAGGSGTAHSSDAAGSAAKGASGKSKTAQSGSGKGKGGSGKSKSAHKRMQLQDVWGVEGLLVYCHGSGRSAKHLRVGALFGGRIACFCGCSELYSGSGFAQHTDNTKHRPLHTVFLLGTKIRLQDALRQVRDDGCSPQDLQSREVAAQGVARVQKLYEQPGMHEPVQQRAQERSPAPQDHPPLASAAVDTTSGLVFRDSTPLLPQTTFSAGGSSGLRMSPGPGGLAGLDDDADFLVSGLLRDSTDEHAFNFDNEMSSRASTPQPLDQAPPGGAFVPSTSIAVQPSATAAVSAARTALMNAHATEAAPTVATATTHAMGQVTTSKAASVAGPTADMTAEQAALHRKTAHLVQQHPLADVVPVSLALAEAIVSQRPHNGVTPFSSLSAEDVEPEKLRKVGLASPSSSFSVHVLHTQLFNEQQRLAAACAAAALVPESLLTLRGQVPLSVPRELGRRVIVPQADAFPPSAIAAPDSNPQPAAAGPSVSVVVPVAEPSAQPNEQPDEQAAPPKPKKPRTPKAAASASSAGDTGAASPSARPAPRKKGTAVVDMTAVQYSVAQAEEIELKALPQPNEEDFDAPSYTVPVWVPLRAPAAVLALHRGMLQSEATGQGGGAAQLTQLPLVLQVGVHIDCLNQGQWWEAVIKRVSGDAAAWAAARRATPPAVATSVQPWGVLVHYARWSKKHDEWVVGDLEMATKFAPLGTYTDPLKLMS